jgi:hypothetical protein
MSPWGWPRGLVHIPILRGIIFLHPSDNEAFPKSILCLWITNTYMWYVFVTKISCPKTNFVFVNHKHIIYSWLDFWWRERGGGSQHTNQSKIKQLSQSSSSHLLVPGVQKESLPGAGWVFLTRGEREVEAPVQGEATARQEGQAVQQEVMLQPPGENKRAAQQEMTQQPDCASKGGCASSGCGAMRSHTKTNRANGRQRRVKRC